MFKNKSNQIRTFFIIWMILICIFEVNVPTHFLILNTFLAYVPIEINFWIQKPQIKHRQWFWLFFIIWLLFYPNTPYLLTDLFHLSLLNPYNQQGLIRLSISMWTSYTFLIISALGCTLIGMAGLNQIAGVIANRFSTSQAWFRNVIIIILTILSSIGVFIGRFLRIHTIYLFANPQLFIRPLIRMWQPKMIAFVVLFTLVQLFINWVVDLITDDRQ